MGGDDERLRSLKQRRAGEDESVNAYRDLMEIPSQFEEGFTWITFIGVLFIAVLMVPGTVFLNLVAGKSLGPAAQWVTVILFIEMARRANKVLKLPEVFMLYFIAGQAVLLPFEGILWNQFFVDSNAARAWGIADDIPFWWCPPDRDVLAKRTIFQMEWIPAIALATFSILMTRINNVVTGYGLFRVASDLEKLPFPKATIQANGIIALSEEQSELNLRTSEVESQEEARKRWRWRVFSIGGIIGLIFSAVYLGLPTITGAVLDQPIQLIPVPFVDWTQKTGDILPAVQTGISLDLSQLIMGMALPYFAMVGTMAGYVLMLIVNPLLYRTGILNSWNPGDDTVVTLMKNNVDFYFSFIVGVTVILFLVGLMGSMKSLRAYRAAKKQGSGGPVAGRDYRARGDIKTPWIILTYVMITMAYILVSGFLINWHPGVMAALFFFGFVYTPLISYTTARLEGMTGEVIMLPLIREASLILSGYSGVKVWFLPLPLDNYGVATVMYRQAELAGTKFSGLWKAIFLLTPVVIVASLLFSSYIWSLADVPSPRYPYAQKMWELQAEQNCIMYSSTMEGFSLFDKAFRPWAIVAGGVFGAAGFGIVSLLGIPVFFMYGVLRGFGMTFPHVVIPNFVGALLGKFYFGKKMGLKWKQYVPVVMSGYLCGTGLLTTLIVGVTFLMKSSVRLPF